MKTRVNSKINNTKGRAKNSFLIKKQGYRSEVREKALGYCTFHQVNVGIKMFERKHCEDCPKYIKYVNKEVK